LSETSEPLISIIILNYNAGQLLLNCVESVLKADYSNIEVIIVDNDSKDQSHIKCKEKFSRIRLIENKENLGYCEGNNVGIRQAEGKFTVILNPDTIVSADWLGELLSAYKIMGEGLYQPKILSLHENNVIQSTGNMLHLFGFGFARDKGVPDNNQRNEIEQIGYASGTCLFTSTEILKRVGLFDSFLFLYHDDLDLGWRAAQLGIKSYYVPNSKVYHVESYSLKWSPKKFFWLERNRRYCLLTRYSKNTCKKMHVYLILVEMMVWLFYLSKGFLMAKIRAELDIINNKDQIRSKYEEIESKKLVPDKELIKLFPDEIFVPKNVSGKIGSRTFNSILSVLSKKAKRSILS
jgi:hypothetical protein